MLAKKINRMKIFCRKVELLFFKFVHHFSIIFQMAKFLNYYRIESARLPNWHYAAPGKYFVVFNENEAVTANLLET